MMLLNLAKNTSLRERWEADNGSVGHGAQQYLIICTV